MEKFYTVEEITAITGLSKDHLTDADGPIARICKAFPEAPLGDRKQGLTYDGLNKLNEYLEALEDGISYEVWAKQSQPQPGNNGCGLVLVPTLQTQIVGVDENIENAMHRLDLLRNQFGTTTGEYRGYFKNLGTLVGEELAAEFSHGVVEAVEAGVKSTYEKLKLT